MLGSVDDGATWTEGGPGGSGQMNAVTWTGDRFVAVGSSAWTSVDGVQWNTFSLGGFFPVMNHLVHADGTLIAGGTNGNMRRSSTGESWTAFSFNPANASTTGIAHGAGTWVAVGEDFFNGYILYSTDGEQWTRSEPAGSRPLSGLAFGNGVFVAVGKNAFFGRTTVLYGSDGVNWQATELNMDPGKLAFDGQQFVHVGTKIMVSSDGTTWQEVPAPAAPPINFLIALDGQLLAFGNQAQIRTASLPDIQQPIVPGILEPAVELGSGWYSTALGPLWLGWWESGWIFHPDAGLLYARGSLNSLWLKRPEGAGWIWTSASVWPLGYDTSSSLWAPLFP